MKKAKRLRLCFVVESGTDVRMVEGLAQRTELTLLAREVNEGRTISQPTSTHFTLWTGPSSFVRFAWFAFRTLVRHRREFDTTLVQGYGPAALAVNLAARLTGLRAVMLVCSPVEGYYQCRLTAGSTKQFKRREWFVIRALAYANARLGRQYVALSQYLEQVVRQHGTSARVNVIPVYGVDTTVFVPATIPRAAIRTQLGLPSACTLVFYSSRIASEKDPDTLIDAVVALRHEGRDVRILHRSGGYNQFHARAAARGLDEVIALDAVAPFDGLVACYQAADVCVQASHDEGLGFSVLESLACEVPVVATAVGGLRETIRDGDTGWTYPPGDSSALADALRQVFDGPAAAAAAATRGRVMVTRCFEQRQVFDDLVILLREQVEVNA